MAITNKKELRWRYEQLSIYNEFRSQSDCPDLIDERIKEIKREIRAYNKRDTSVNHGMGYKCEHRIVKDNGIDGFVELVSIPEAFDTIDGAETFFKDFLEIQARPSMYDCTGQAFTSWYKIFKRRGQFWAYHGVSFDV